MSTAMNMVYWKGEMYWVGKLLDHPEIMSQGETVEELEANLREAYLLMAMDDVPEEHSIKPITMLSSRLARVAARPEETIQSCDVAQSDPIVAPLPSHDITRAACDKYTECIFRPKNVCAFAHPDSDGGVVVLRGSTAVGDKDLQQCFSPSNAKLRERLKADKSLVTNERGVLLFTRDVPFDNWSVPACIVAGNSRSGNQDSWYAYMDCWKEGELWLGKLLLSYGDELVQEETVDKLAATLRQNACNMGFCSWEPQPS